MASVLYQLGPDCASSHQQAVEAVIERSGFGVSLDTTNDTSVISSPPISREEVQSLIQVGGWVGGVCLGAVFQLFDLLCFVVLYPKCVSVILSLNFSC